MVKAPVPRNTLIRILPERVGEPTRRTNPFFLAERLLDRHGAGNTNRSHALCHSISKKGFLMLKLKNSLAAGALSLAVTLTSFMPAHAVTFSRVPVPEASAVEQVQYREDRRNRWDRRDRVDRRDRYERRADRRWKGHRGYRDHRPGYRRHSDGWWYPLAAFGIGAAIGGAIANDRNTNVGGSHASWCANRYRSYRAYDNTFQPYNGPRQQCMSPYAR